MAEAPTGRGSERLHLECDDLRRGVAGCAPRCTFILSAAMGTTHTQSYQDHSLAELSPARVDPSTQSRADSSSDEGQPTSRRDRRPPPPLPPRSIVGREDTRKDTHWHSSTSWGYNRAPFPSALQLLLRQAKRASCGLRARRSSFHLGPTRGEHRASNHRAARAWHSRVATGAPGARAGRDGAQQTGCYERGRTAGGILGFRWDRRAPSGGGVGEQTPRTRSSRGWWPYS